YVSRRVHQLGIETLVDAVVAPADHGRPGYAPPLEKDLFPLAATKQLTFPAALRKPDPRTLAPILGAFPFMPDQIAYVGDNLSRDVLLARRAGIRPIWARYGARHDQRLRE